MLSPEKQLAVTQFIQLVAEYRNLQRLIKNIDDVGVDEITDPLPSTRPYQISSKRGLSERSIFSSIGREWVRKSNKRLAELSHNRLGLIASRHYQKLQETKGASSINDTYVFLGEAISVGLSTVIGDMAKEDTCLLLGLVLAWDANGIAGFYLALESISDLAHSGNPLDNEMFKAKFFTATFSESGDSQVEDAVVHCPYHSFSIVFIHEMERLFSQIEIPKMSTSKDTRKENSKIIHELALSIGRSVDDELSSLLAKYKIKLGRNKMTAS